MKWTKPDTMILGMLAAALLVSVNAFPADPAAKNSKPLAGYSTIVVEKFTIQNDAATEKFPRGYETVMGGEAVRRLREKNLFAQVIDAEASAVKTDPLPDPTKEPARALTLSGTVIAYDQGSRTARYLVGFGAGATRVTVRFVLRATANGQEILQIDR